MEEYCSIHSQQKAITYCKDHTVLCCDKCNLQHNTDKIVAIQHYKTASSLIKKYHQLKLALKKLDSTKLKLCNIFDVIQNNISNQIDSLEKICDKQILKALEKQCEISQATQKGVDSTINELIQNVKNICANIVAVQIEKIEISLINQKNKEQIAKPLAKQAPIPQLKDEKYKTFNDNAINQIILKDLIMVYL